MSAGMQCFEVCLLGCGILNVTAYRANGKTSVRVLVLSQAELSRVNPLYYSFPVSVACSTGLLLPVASVPMALAHEALLGYEASKMFVPVVIIKSVTVLAIFVSVHTTGGYYYGFNIYPEWANKSSNNTNK
ncbi:unnamed protein product [Ixodes pacificus]